jgi:glycosyltransferase involved in cell wall biosynthesis
MAGAGERFLARALQSIKAQNFTDYEIIVSDHSADDKIKRLCTRFSKLRYVRNPEKRGNAAANLNNALEHAKGTPIKLVFQDDFLAGPGSLRHMMDQLGGKPWLIHAYWHTDFFGHARLEPTRPWVPDDHESLLLVNSIGAPTAVMFKKNDLRFDENLSWYMDCEFYFRLLQRFGLPVIVPEPLAVQTLWPGQLTHKIADDAKAWEADYIRKTYGLGVSYSTGHSQ